MGVEDVEDHDDNDDHDDHDDHDDDDDLRVEADDVPLGEHADGDVGGGG